MIRHAAAGLLALGLAACTTVEDQSQAIPDWLTGEKWDIDRVAALPLNEDPYLGALQEGYIRLSREELAEFDWDSGALFARKARIAAQGPVAPTDPASESVDEDAATELGEAFAQVNGFIGSEGAMLRAGRQIGEAQVFFDCWLQEAVEGHQLEEIAECRDQFGLMIQLIRDLAALPKNMAVVLPEDGEIGGIEVTQGNKTVTLDRPFAAAGTGKELGDVPVVESEIRDAFAGALAAQPKPPVEFVLTFDFNDTKITDTAFEQILLAADEARSRDAAEVIVTGFADAPGAAPDNLAISRTRAERVRKAVFFELREAEKVSISTEARGERDLAVEATGQEEQNRRVIILVR
ncbi:MAG: OmpA family protein [Pseudomonadota bacterium]